MIVSISSNITLITNTIIMYTYRLHNDIKYRSGCRKSGINKGKKKDT